MIFISQTNKLPIIYLAIKLGWWHHICMKAHTLDLRRKVVEAVQQGMPKAEAARTVGVGISTVKRYVAKVNKGESLAPRKPPGKKRKLDRRARELLVYDLNERATATLTQRCSYLERVTGTQLSEATVSRAIKRLGWVREKHRWVQRR